MDVSSLEPLVNLITPDRCSDQIKKVSCKKQIDAALIQSAQLIGFDYVRCIRWVSAGKKNLVDSYSGHVCNFPDDWVAYYDEGKLHQWDPIIRFYMDVEPNLQMPHGTWRQARDRALKNPLGETSEEMRQYSGYVDQLYNEANKYGVTSGVFITTGDRYSRIHMSLGCSEPEDQLEQRLSPGFWSILKTMQVLTKELFSYTQGCNQCVSGIRMPGLRYENLTKAQRKILMLFIDNRCATIKDISVLYDSSVDNINYHLKNIRAKFGCLGVSGHVLAQFAREHKLI